MNRTTTLKRLKHFVTVMESVPEEKFRIGNWMDIHAFSEPLNVVVPDTFVEVDCRTSACALGWAALDKKFIKLKLVWEDRTIRFNNKEWEDAGIRFFGITEREAFNLFFDKSYRVDPVKPKHVIRRLKNLIKKYECNGRILS